MLDLSLFDLSGKKALVTGGAMGVGRACALSLAKSGADVAIVDLNEDMGRRTTAAIRDIGRNAIFVRCDVSQPDSVQAMIDAIVLRFGRLDIAVNNAGMIRFAPDESQPKEDWDQVINVNLTGTWLCAKAEMQQMIKQTPTEGKIINIGSIAAVCSSISGSYDASKAAVVHLTRTLAARWGRYNINVNCVSPGYVIGGMGMDRSIEERQRLRAVIPLGHIQRLEDLFGPIVFLACKASDYITGQNLIVDGGHTLSTWMSPLERSVPPRIDSTGEIAELKRELTARGIPHDDNGAILR